MHLLGYGYQLYRGWKLQDSENVKCRWNTELDESVMDFNFFSLDFTPLKVRLEGCKDMRDLTDNDSTLNAVASMHISCVFPTLYLGLCNYFY